jgi:hypothetical protein
MVTLPGSPPNCTMFCWTQRRAITWSFRPLLPGSTESPVLRNPKRKSMSSSVPEWCRLCFTDRCLIYWFYVGLCKLSETLLTLSSWSWGSRLSPLGTSDTIWCIVPALDDGRWRLWSSLWNN